MGDLCEKIKSSSDLAHIRNCGAKSVSEIMDKLFAYNYSILDEKGRNRFLNMVVEVSVGNNIHFT